MSNQFFEGSILNSPCVYPGCRGSLMATTSRPFDKPKSGRIAVKVINHLCDELMKAFKVL